MKILILLDRKIYYLIGGVKQLNRMKNDISKKCDIIITGDDNMNNDIKELEKRISDIEKRNKKVEGDKAWETSTLRKILIIVLTYIFAVLYLKIADTTNPFFGAVVPCVGFFLSTQTLNVIKKNWLNKRK